MSWKNRHCDKCNCSLEGVGQYKLTYGRDYWVCGSCMQQIVKKELLTSNCFVKGSFGERYTNPKLRKKGVKNKWNLKI